jgi:hypothetical protein
MKRFVTLCVLIFAVSVRADDTLSRALNFIGISPIMPLFGILDGEYEHRFGHHGLAIGGQYALPLLEEAYSVSVDYRYHFTKDQLSRFIGPYFRTGYLAQEITDSDRSKYRYSLKYTSIGIDYGKRAYLWEKIKLLYSYRIGIGYPFESKIDWHGARPESIGGISIGTFEGLIKISSYIDGELTIGWAF